MWIELKDEEHNKKLYVPRHDAGGILKGEEITEPRLFIPDRWKKHFNFKGLKGIVASKTSPRIFKAMEKLATPEAIIKNKKRARRVYQKDTKLNNAVCLARLLAWSRRYPSATWRAYQSSRHPEDLKPLMWGE